MVFNERLADTVHQVVKHLSHDRLPDLLSVLRDIELSVPEQSAVQLISKWNELLRFVKMLAKLVLAVAILIISIFVLCIISIFNKMVHYTGDANSNINTNSNSSNSTKNCGNTMSSHSYSSSIRVSSDSRSSSTSSSCSSGSSSSM